MAAKLKFESQSSQQLTSGCTGQILAVTFFCVAKKPPSKICSVSRALSVFMKEIERWNKNNKTFGLQLPDGWFGRPGDNQHRLTGSFDRDNKLILEFDSQLYLIFTKPIVIEKSNNDLVISNFEQLIFDYQGYGDMTPHAKNYKSGAVTLVSYSL